MVTPEQIDTLIKGSESVASVLTGFSSELVAESLNLFILTSVLHILKVASVFILFFVLKKYLNYLKEVKLFEPFIFKGIELFMIISSLGYFLHESYPHLETILKIQVAPKVFLLEKGSELLKGNLK